MHLSLSLRAHFSPGNRGRWGPCRCGKLAGGRDLSCPFSVLSPPEKRLSGADNAVYPFLVRRWIDRY